MRINRRRFLRQGCLAAATLGTFASARLSSHAAAGKAIGEAFDDQVKPFMEARKIPGGALAVIKDRRLVYAQAYGFADLEKREPTRPDSLFRIASISKPFTAVAVLKLVAAGRLQMDAPAFALLQLEPLPGKEPDPRLQRITARHLLHHTAGWDRDQSGDPMFMSKKIAVANGEPPPANQHAIIRYMLGQPLDFDPGARYAYSNFGYCVLGRIIEKITGQGYAEFVQQAVLAPIGIRRMRQGISRLSGRAEGEVKYYMPGRNADFERFSRNDRAGAEPYTGFCLGGDGFPRRLAGLSGGFGPVRGGAGRPGARGLAAARLKPRRLLSEPPAPPVSQKASGWHLADRLITPAAGMVRPARKRGPRQLLAQRQFARHLATLLVRRHDPAWRGRHPVQSAFERSQTAGWRNRRRVAPGGRCRGGMAAARLVWQLRLMNCFKHQAVAVAVCPWCGRAMCAPCASAASASAGLRLACSEECVQALARSEGALEMLLQKSRQSARANSVYCYLCAAILAGATIAAWYELPSPLLMLVYGRVRRGAVHLRGLVWTRSEESKN